MHGLTFKLFVFFSFEICINKKRKQNCTHGSLNVTMYLHPYIRASYILVCAEIGAELY